MGKNKVKKRIESFDLVAKKLTESRDIKKDLYIVKNNYSVDFINRNFKKLTKVKSIEKAILGNLVVDNYSDFYNEDLAISSNIKKELLWLANTLLCCNVLLNEFIELRNSFYGNLLLSEKQKALNDLNLIESKFGKSVWLIQNRIGWHGHFEGVEEQKKYSSMIYDDPSTPQSLEFSVKQFSLREIPSLSTKRYDSSISNLANELELAKVTYGPAYLRYFLNFFGCSSHSELEEIIAGLIELPIVDRYTHFLRVVQYVISSGYSGVSEKELLKLVSIVNNEISDYYLDNIFAHENSPKQQELLPFDYYTVGNYESAIDACEWSISNNVLRTELYEIYVKSSYLLGRRSIDYMDGTLCNKIMNDMLTILVEDENKSALSQESIFKLSYVFSSDLLFFPIFYFAKSGRKHLNSQQEKYMSCLASLSPAQLNPKRLISACSYEKLTKGDTGITIEFLLAYKSRNLEHFQSLDVSKERKEFYFAKLLYEDEQYDESLNEFRSLCNRANALVSKPSIFFITKILLKLNRLSECLDFSGETLCCDKTKHLKVPLAEILDTVTGSDDHEVYKNINLVFLYYFYAKNIGSERNEEFCDAYDEFMYSHQLSYPLDILQDETFSDSEKIFFLKNISTPNIIDVSENYKSNDDVISDRIQICYALMDIDSDNSEQYDNEVTYLIEKIILEKSMVKISEGRVHVDTEGIKNNLAQNIREKLITFNSIKGKSEIEKKYVDHSDTGEEFILPTDESGLLIVNTLEEVRDEFCTNNEYGLDGNISLEIRHGHVSAQLRCPFEKSFLVTEKDENNKYVKNEYWFQKYPIIKYEILEEVDACLQRFSQNIDDLIEEVRSDWLKVDPYQGSFYIDFTDVDLIALQKKLLSGPDEFEVLDFIIESLWIKTEYNLEEIKSRLTNELLLSIEALISDLLVAIKEAKRGIYLQDLEDSILNAKNEIHTSVDEICKWFNRSKRNETPDFELMLPIRLSIDTLSSIYGLELESFIVNEATTRSPIAGEYLNDFVMIYITLLRNAIKHSRVAGRSKITISVETNNDFATVKLSNKILLDEQRVAEVEKLKAIEEVLLTRKYYDVVNKEGKTGLYKVDKILNTKLKGGHQLDFGIVEDLFTVQIHFDLKGVYS